MADPIIPRLQQRHELLATAKCSLSYLQPQPIEQCPRQLDLKNVARLVEIYKLEGCRRLERQNFVPVIMTSDAWNTIPRSGGIDGTLQWLKPDRQLVYLHGRHRIEAAKKFLHPDDRWWIVEIYAATDAALERQLAESHSNAKNFYDGDIYRHWRRALKSKDREQEQKWLAMLSATKKRDLLQMEKRTYKDAQMYHLQEGFDALLPFVGLWPALQIGTFHRILSLRCPEEMCRYLRWIRIVWDDILDNCEDYRQRLDAGTVSIVQGLFPKCCTNDRLAIERKSKMIMPLLSERERAKVLDRIRGIDSPIPSIYTFLEDTKLLEPCAKIMKSLLPSMCRTSIYREYMQSHNSQHTWALFTGEATSDMQQEASVEAARTKGYRQLWLFALRHFPEMLGQRLRKDKGEPTPPTPSIELIWKWAMSKSARFCGFAHLLHEDTEMTAPTKAMADAFIPRIRPPLIYEYTSETAFKSSETICTSVQDIPLVVSRKASQPPSTDCGQDIVYRCGVPHNTSFRLDQEFLFLSYVDNFEVSQQKRTSITSFAVKQFFFWAFLGRPETNVLGPQPESLPTAPASETNVLDPRPELPRTAPAPKDNSIESIEFAGEPQTPPGGLAQDNEPLDPAGTNEPPEASQGTTFATANVDITTLPTKPGKSSSQFKMTYHKASKQQHNKGRLTLVSVKEDGTTYEISDLQRGADSSLRSIERKGTFCFSYDRKHKQIKIKPPTDLNGFSYGIHGPAVLCPETRSRGAMQAVREVEQGYEKKTQRQPQQPQQQQYEEEEEEGEIT